MGIKIKNTIKGTVSNDKLVAYHSGKKYVYKKILDSFPKSVMLDYVLENYYDELRECVAEQESDNLHE